MAGDPGNQWSCVLSDGKRRLYDKGGLVQLR